MTRVVFVVIDALPLGLVGNTHTPHLSGLAAEGGSNPHGGRAVLSTATYPNHASFATGLPPADHGILVNRVWNGQEFRPASETGPRGDTIFTAAREHGRSSAIVVGDHHLVGVMGGFDADRHWPPEGMRPDVALDEFRYATNAAVIAAVDETDLIDADLCVVHFNEPDTVSHRFGPDAPELAACARQTDAALGELIERLRPRWDETVVMVVSDHDQELVTAHGMDLAAELAARGLPGTVETEGTAALVMDGPPVERLRELDSVEDGHVIDDRNTIVWGKPGVVFGPWLDELRGSHGSPRCARQVAVVGGGDPAAVTIGKAVATARPDATWWAPTITRLLTD